MSSRVITFGCRLNSYESEIIKKHLLASGLQNTIVINSCAVTSEAEKDLQRTIRRLKKQNRFKIVLTGCAAQIDPQKYSTLYGVDAILGNSEKLELENYKNLSLSLSLSSPSSTQENIISDIMALQETASHMIEHFEGRTRAFLQVQNGCNHRCTFCIIPYGRGNSRSIPIDQITNQARILVANGYKEIVLTGVDITDYGIDLPGTPTLGRMVKSLLNLVPELKRIRLSSVDVAEFDCHLIDLIANEERFMPHLHLSLQSGDDLILKRMKRRHNRKQVLEFCSMLRKLRSDIAFGADVIVGFPTESIDMFHRTCDLIEKANIVHLHVFPYSEREGTPAARMPQLPKVERKKRALFLRDLGKTLLTEHYKAQSHKVAKLLIEEGNKGRTENFSLVHLTHDSFTSSLPGDILLCSPYFSEDSGLLVV